MAITDNWIEYANTITGTVSDSAYGNGRYVACTNLGVFYSSDGIAWSQSVSPSSLNAVAFGNGKFIGVRNDEAWSSIDGVTWTQLTIPLVSGSYLIFTSIIYAGGRFVAVVTRFTDFLDGVSRSMISIDGTTWTLHVMPDTDWFDISFGDNKYVVISRSGQSSTSTDGQTWTPLVLIVSGGEWNAITYGNGYFVALRQSNFPSFSRSSDGITWQNSIFFTSSQFKDIAFGNGYFMAVALSAISNSQITAYSTDGLSWTNKFASTSGIDDVLFANQKFIAFSVGENHILDVTQNATLAIGTTKGSLNLTWTNGTCTILPSDVVQYEFKLYLNSALYLTQILTRNSKYLEYQPAGDYYFTVDVIKNDSFCSSATSNTVTILPYEFDYDFTIQITYGKGTITINGAAPLTSYSVGTQLNISTTLGTGFNSVKWYDSSNPSVELSDDPSFIFTMPRRDVRIYGIMSGEYLPIDEYGLKYFAEYGSIEGNCKRLEILKDKYNPALGNSEVKIGEVTFGWGNQGDDPLKTIIGSYLDFELIGVAGDFEEFLEGDAKEFQVKYYENRTDTVPFFVGYISPDFITVQETQTIQRYSFTAIDGLKSLDAVRANTQWESNRADLAISGALNQEFPTIRNVNYRANIWENRMNQSQNLFAQFNTPYNAIYNDGRIVDFKDGERIINERLKLSDVIERLVNPFLCRVFLWRNEFYVTRIPDIISDPISEVDVSCIINNPEKTARRVYTEFTGVLKLASLDFSAKGGIIDQIKSIDDWTNSILQPIYRLRWSWAYVNAIPSNRPTKRPETSTALVQYNEEYQSARIWASSSQQGIDDPLISYIDYSTAFSGIGIAQEKANTLSISFEYMAWPTTTVTATTLNTYRMAFRIKVGSFYLRKINETQFEWTTDETDIVERIPGATVFHKYSISNMVVPEDGDIEVRFYQILCIGGQAHLFSIDWKNLNINIEGNTSLSLAEIAVKAQTNDRYNNEHPDYVTYIGDAETNNSTSAIQLTGINEFSVSWGRGGSESLPLLDLIVQDLANLKGRRNLRIRGTVERQEIKPYQLIEYNGEKFMVISIKLDTYRNRWECELFQLS